jgi:trans-aconitate 2-methyltransferase
MAWNPVIYNKFRDERYEPFYDLLSLIQIKQGLNVIDLGCGTGELTRKLADHLPGSNVTGIDSSGEMLKETEKYSNSNVRFQQTDIRKIIEANIKYDLVFSNAALQWVDDHKKLLPQIIGLVKKNGQLAIQVPSNHTHFTHITLNELAAEEPYQQALQGWIRKVPVLDIESYAQLFSEYGCSEMTIYEKLYPHILKNADAVFDWVSGTAMLRYLERLPENLKESFVTEYKRRLHAKYGNSKPVFYSFKRIIMSAIF